MARRVSFSNENLSIDEIAYYKQDLEKAISLYYKRYSEYEKFQTFNLKELTKEKALRLKELELNAIFMLLSSVEALFRIDFNIRVNKKLKDELSREFRDIYKNKQKRISLNEDILKTWQSNFVSFESIITKYKETLKYRHWLAHGRYWEPKFQKYDFDSVYIVADSIISNLPLQEVV